MLCLLLVVLGISTATADYWKLLENSLKKLTDASGFIFSSVDENSDDLQELVRLVLYNTIGGLTVSILAFMLIAVAFKRINEMQSRIIRIQNELDD